MLAEGTSSRPSRIRTCADLIGKVRQLHEQGEPEARALTEQVESAQGNPDPAAVRIMRQVEGSLLQTAVALELIDATQERQLERLREDRNPCAHPSLRPLGELFDPQPEYARAHLAVALDAVLVHPASQGPQGRGRLPRARPRCRLHRRTRPHCPGVLPPGAAGRPAPGGGLRS